MKPKPDTTTATLPKAKNRLRRAASPAATSRQGIAPAAPVATASSAAGFLAALAPAPVTGKIRLETSSMTFAQLGAQLQRVKAGMAATPVYGALPVAAEVNTGAAAIKIQLEELASMERALKEFRLSLESWALTYASLLNRAALACETADSTPATLVGGGWDLRRAPGPPQPLPAPASLGIQQTAFAGEGTGRWRSVPNARYYELRVDPVPGTALTIPEPITLTSTRTRVALPSVAPGTQVALCVRAVGAKGTGPFCDPIIVRIN